MRYVIALLCALVLCVSNAGAKTLPPVRIVTEAYTLDCASTSVGKKILLVCAPKRTTAAARNAAYQVFGQYGTALPRALFVNAPTGNGAPPVCDETTTTCLTTGMVALNLGQANTWTATQTFANIVNNGLSANDNCAATNASKQMVDGTCALAGAANNFTALNTFNAAIAFSATTVTAPTIGLAGNSSSDLEIYSGHNINLHNKLQVQAGGINMGSFALASLGHEGTAAACAVSGTATIPSAGGDAACLVTLASGTATITFKTAYTGASAPVCTATDETSTSGAGVSLVPSGSSGAWTGYVLHGTSADVIAVRCTANGGS